MTGARDVGGASVAARRLLVLAGAVAGIWLVSWLTSSHADAAEPPGLPDPIGVVAGAARAPVAIAEPAATVTATDRVTRVAAGRSRVAGAVVGSASRGAGVVVPPAIDAGGPVAGRGSGAAAGASVVAEPVSRAAGAVVSPVTGAGASVVSRVVAPGKSVSGGAGAVVSSAVGVAGVVEPVSRAAATVVSPVTGAAAAVVSRVAVSAKPVLGPVSRVAGAVVSPVSGALAPVSHLVRSVGPILTPLTRPLAGLVAPLTGSVGGLLRPVLGTAAPGLTGLLAPVAADVPIVAPVTGVVGPAGRTPGTKTAGLIKLIHLADPVVSSVGAAGTPLASGKSGPVAAPAADVAHPVAPGAACHGTSGPRSHRAAASAPRTGSPAGLPGHAPPSPVPFAPSAPSDVSCGSGSVIPLAFLASGHGPRDFRVFPRAHGVFVPLWRPCEPGTGPG